MKSKAIWPICLIAILAFSSLSAGEEETTTEIPTTTEAAHVMETTTKINEEENKIVADTAQVPTKPPVNGIGVRVGVPGVSGGPLGGPGGFYGIGVQTNDGNGQAGASSFVGASSGPPGFGGPGGFGFPSGFPGHWRPSGGFAASITPDGNVVGVSSGGVATIGNPSGQPYPPFGFPQGWGGFGAPRLPNAAPTDPKNPADPNAENPKTPVGVQARFGEGPINPKDPAAAGNSPSPNGVNVGFGGPLGNFGGFAGFGPQGFGSGGFARGGFGPAGFGFPPNFGPWGPGAATVGATGKVDPKQNPNGDKSLVTPEGSTEVPTEVDAKIDGTVTPKGDAANPSKNFGNPGNFGGFGGFSSSGSFAGPTGFGSFGRPSGFGSFGVPPLFASRFGDIPDDTDGATTSNGVSVSATSTNGTDTSISGFASSTGPDGYIGYSAFGGPGGFSGGFSYPGGYGQHGGFGYRGSFGSYGR